MSMDFSTKQVYYKKIISYINENDIPSLDKLFLSIDGDEEKPYLLEFAMREAISRRKYDILEHLIEIGGNVNARVYFGTTPLAYFAKRNNFEMVKKMIINYGADVNGISVWGNSALMFAVWNENIDMINFLIERGINVNLANKRKLTPLMAATIKENISIVKILLNNGADINMTDIGNYNALRYAIERNNETLIAILKEHGSEVIERKSIFSNKTKF
jgi:ankyrin repeat protein